MKLNQILELAYPKNLGVMEMFKFYQLASKAEKDQMQALINKNDFNACWELLQRVTGVKLAPVNESISAVKNSIQITTQHDRSASTIDSISTYFKKVPYHTALQHNEIYSILNYISTPETMKLLTSLKGRGPYNVSAEQLDRFLTQVTDACAGLIKRLNPEVIIYSASTSPLIGGFVSHLKETHPKIKVASEAFIKKSLAGADVKAVLNTEHPEWTKFADENPKAVLQLKQSLKHHLESGELELKKLYKPYLKFIKNFIQLKDVSDTIDVVNEKRVLIVDDVLSTGTTIREMIRQIEELEPAQVSTLTIFKRTNLVSVSRMIPVAKNVTGHEI